MRRSGSTVRWSAALPSITCRGGVSVLGDFAQGKQPDGADRALKVMIKKKNIDNFLIYSEASGANH